MESEVRILSADVVWTYNKADMEEKDETYNKADMEERIQLAEVKIATT